MKNEQKHIGEKEKYAQEGEVKIRNLAKLESTVESRLYG